MYVCLFIYSVLYVCVDIIGCLLFDANMCYYMCVGIVQKIDNTNITELSNKC